MRKSVVYLSCVVILSVSLVTSCSKKNNTDKDTDIVTVTPEATPSFAPEGEENEFTKEDAYKKLSKISKDVLELPAPLSEYTIMYDDYTTIISEQECYGINVYSKVEDKMILMKVLYVTVDGNAMYKFDVTEDDFVEIK